MTYNAADVQDYRKRCREAKNGSIVVAPDGMDTTLANKIFDEERVALAELAAETFAPIEQIAQLLGERGGTHGNWREQASLAQKLKAGFMTGNWPNLRPDERETLEMIAMKISRILTGDPHFEDHWRDIAGYATLAADLNKPA